MARLLTLFLSLLTGTSAVLAARPNAEPVKPRIPGAYIFEFEDGKDTSDVYSKIDTDGDIRKDLNYKLFKGVSVQLKDVENSESTAAAIAANPAVKNFWPVELVHVPNDEIKWTGSSSTQSSSLSKRANETDTFSPHVMTQVDKLRAKGFTGKGIKIAVIDTGIDYTHPALGGCFGEGCLVAFGTDFVGDDYNGANTAVPDNDPKDCYGHGTHVAGTIAAQDNEYGFTGVAPDAILGAYKVFGCNGSAGNDVLIAAYHQAFEDGADIITASIVSDSGWTEEPWAVAVSRIAEQGVPCPVSAGNSGANGQFFGSAAANGKGVLAVASVENTLQPSLLSLSNYSVDGGEAKEFGYSAASHYDWDGVRLPLWTPDLNTTVVNSGCNPYSDDTPDLSGYIVLVRRGTCLYVDKAVNAGAKGAKYIIYYNDRPGTIDMDVGDAGGILAASMVTPETGAVWVNLLAAGSEVVLDITGRGKGGMNLIQPDNPITGGAISTFTSWGPTYGLDVKPQIGAPGGSILSTYAVALGSYAVLSGTSMACPLVAGALALISEVRGSFDPALLETLLSANANPQLFNDGKSFYDFLAPVPQQGGGLIQAYDAAYATTLLEPSSLSFNETAHFTKELNFTLRNTGTDEITYEITHVPAISMYTFNTGSIYPSAFPNEHFDAAASLAFSETKITIPAGESAAVEVIPTPPEGVDSDRFPVWSGYIAVNGSDGSSLSLPYQGATGSIYEHVVLGPGDAWVGLSNDEALNPVGSNLTITLPAQGTAPTEDTVLPIIAVYMALGTPNMRAEVISAANGTSVGIVEGFPVYWRPRGLNPTVWTGKLENGDYAPAGQYKIIVKALRILGDTEKEKDWDTAETQAFSIQYAQGK